MSDCSDGLDPAAGADMPAGASRGQDRGVPDPIALRPIARVSNGGLFAVAPQIADPLTSEFETVDSLLFDGRPLDWRAARLRRLLEEAVSLYADGKFPRTTRLVLPYELKFLHAPETTPKALHALAQSRDINGDNLVLALYVTDPAGTGEDLEMVRSDADRLGMRTALVRFGEGAANADILKTLKPRYVCLNPSLIQKAHHSATDKKLLRAIMEVGLAVDSRIIVAGVDTPAALYTARDLGIEFAVGDMIGMPDRDNQGRVDEAAFDILTRKALRKSEIDDADMIRKEIFKIDALEITQPVQGLFEIFRRHKDKGVVPIVDAEGTPLGIVRESTIKDYIYSQFGRDLLSNSSYQKTIANFMSPCPAVPLNSTAEKVLDAYSRMDVADGVLITQNGRYFGFLSAAALLHIINEKNLQFARDQNPLTRLPGNKAIERFIDDATAAAKRRSTLVYFDIDDFKPFNDVYGFRQGDRVLVLISEILKKNAPPGTFIGHIGGDDFFLGLRDLDVEEATAVVDAVQTAFKDQVQSFYSDSDRDKGFLTAKDRFGIDRRFALMTVSAAVLHLTDRRKENTVDALFQIVGTLKKQAKSAVNRRALYAG
ncbi:MAG: EAL domain-containing protein [Alphaproteobacteria bacterium]|nr:EAL domain-containing protein [Alphaproteobacteria bacterium]